uniref:Uncharacterized protein n=1 Tax=Anguilla anguilla TaxID=7936 RepID=A0A0E9S301_ANGAN
MNLKASVELCLFLFCVGLTKEHTKAFLHDEPFKLASCKRFTYHMLIDFWLHISVLAAEPTC